MFYRLIHCCIAMCFVAHTIQPVGSDPVPPTAKPVTPSVPMPPGDEFPGAEWLGLSEKERQEIRTLIEDTRLFRRRKDHTLHFTYKNPEKTQTHPGQRIPIQIHGAGLPAGVNESSVRIKVQSADSNVADVLVNQTAFTIRDGEIDESIIIHGGTTYGITTINVTTSWLYNGTDHVQSAIRTVTVLRPPHKVRVQKILNWLTITFCLILIFFMGCQCTMYEIKKIWKWLIACMILQLVVLPLFCWGMTKMLKLENLQMLGVLATSYSPVGFTFTAMAILMQADLTLACSLLLVNYLLANIFLPLWSLQFRDLDPFSIQVHHIAFDAIDIPLVFAAVLFLLGMLVNYALTLIADTLRKVTPIAAGIVLVFSVFAKLFGGADLFPSLAWKETLLCLFWPLIILVSTIVVFATFNVAGPRFRAAAMFLLIKGYAIPSDMLTAGIPHPQVHVSQATCFLFSLVTLVLATSTVLAYSCYMCIADDADEKMNPTDARDREGNKLVIELDASKQELPPPYLEEMQSSYGRSSSDYEQIGETIGIAEANSTAGSFGAPVIGI